MKSMLRRVNQMQASLDAKRRACDAQTDRILQLLVAPMVEENPMLRHVTERDTDRPTYLAIANAVAQADGDFDRARRLRAEAALLEPPPPPGRTRLDEVLDRPLSWYSEQQRVQEQAMKAAAKRMKKERQACH